jgi:hypothetical protein
MGDIHHRHWARKRAIRQSKMNLGAELLEWISRTATPKHPAHRFTVGKCQDGYSLYCRGVCLGVVATPIVSPKR